MAVDTFVGTSPGGLGAAHPEDPLTAPGGGQATVIQPRTVIPPAATQTVSIPAVDAVERVTANPFVRGALTGALVGAVVVGAAWWFTR